MKTTMSKSMAPLVDRRRTRSLLCRFLPTVILLSAAFFIASAFIVMDYKERLSRWRIVYTTQNPRCVDYQCKPYDALPKGIVAKTSNLEMRPLWGRSIKKKARSMNLLAIAAGIKQKESVNKIVKRFPSRNFVVMLFHYDGIVNEWMDLEWSNQAIHVSAINQTKWWFAKRFLHPDIVQDYAYIFLWDEDLGVDGFHVGKYLSIVKEEGLEISQPALDANSSEVHHQITAREKRSRVHRRIYKLSGAGRRCDADSSGPPCTGWVEMMAPVFSRASWRCVWYLIQGNQTKNIGIIVDSEYIVHYGLPTLGGLTVNKMRIKASGQGSQNLSRQIPTGRHHLHPLKLMVDMR